jgi:EAL and modified HD-GYP domain-containing signal transduction protein
LTQDSTNETVYVARQTIVSKDCGTIGYELLFRNGMSNSFPDISPDEATSRLISDAQLDVGIEKLVGEHRAFINFTEKSLIEKFPQFFNKEKIVVEIIESVTPTEDVVAACAELKHQGYHLALDDFDFSSKWKELSRLVDIIKIDIEGMDEATLAAKVREIKTDDIELVAERVETHKQFEYCKQIGFDYFQGYFFSQPEIIQNRTIPSDRLSLLQLMGETSKHPMEFEKVSEMISRDVGISYKLLKLINSPAIGCYAEISSLDHALAYLGEKELRKFICLMAMASIGNDKPAALLSLASMRARHAELLMRGLREEANAGKAFLCGLFSLIDAVMNDTLPNIFASLPIDQAIKSALLGSEDTLGKVLRLVLAYENGSWKQVTDLCEGLELPETTLAHYYSDAVQWTRDFESAMVVQ